jgi:ATP-dependent Zn protease
MVLYAGRVSEKIFVGEVTCGAEDDYMKARKILKRLVMNGMMFPEYNFVENSSKDDKVPEYVENKLITINKIILRQVENLLISSKDIVYKTAEKIMEFDSIIRNQH